jgi:hypothetical protein
LIIVLSNLKSTLDSVPHDGWITFSSAIHRINDSPFIQLETFGRTQMTLEWFLQLMMSLECDIFIGTLGSNWNRLIAELRCIWIDSCEAPYMEVGFRDDWVDYSW